MATTMVDFAALAETLRRVTVEISGEGGTLGAGVLWPRGSVVTNAHVIHQRRVSVRLADGVRLEAVSAEEVTRAYLDRIDRHNGRLNALVHVDAESALDQARAVDRKRRNGEPLGALAGVPVAVKDALCTIGTPTTCGSTCSLRRG